MKKRFLSCLLILCMVFSLLPVSALATTDVEVTLGRKSLGQIERTLEMNTGISGYKDTTQQLAPESVTLPVGQQGSFQRLPTTIINNVQYSPKSYGVIRGRCVDVSDPEVVGNFQYSLEYYTGTNYPCLQFNYTAKQAGTATITLEFFYNFGFNPIEAPDIGNTWWRQTKTINVTVTDSATEPEKPEKPTVSDIKRFHNKVNTTSSSEGAVYMWCADSLYDHGAWFSYLTDVEGGYSLGEVVANTESNAASYPWVCPMTVYGDKYLAAYNSAPGFTRHWLEDGEPVSQTVNWYYSAGDGMWKYKSKAAPIYFDITHDNPYPTPTTTDFANQAILVKCDTDDNHNAQLLYSDGTYTISWAGDDRCTLTFDVDSYVAAYGQTHEGHTAVEGQTVTKGFSYSNGKWRADDTSGPEIHVVCESTQPERPTEFGKEQLAGMQVNVQCKTVTGHAKSYYFGELAGCYSTSDIMTDSNGGYYVTVTLTRAAVVTKFNGEDDSINGGKTHEDTTPNATTSWTWTWNASEKTWNMDNAPMTDAWATIVVKCNGSQPETPPTKPTDVFGQFYFQCVNTAAGHGSKVLAALAAQGGSANYSISEVLGDATSGYYVNVTVDASKYLAEYNTTIESEHRLVNDADKSLIIRFNYVNNDWTQETPEPTVEVTCAAELVPFELVIYRNGDTSTAYKTVRVAMVEKGTDINTADYPIGKYYDGTNSGGNYDFYGWYDDGLWNVYKRDPANPPVGLTTKTVNGWTNLKCMVYDYEKVVYFQTKEALTDYQNDHSKTDGILYNTTARKGDTLPTADAPAATREGYTFKYWSREGQSGDVTGQPVNGWTNLYANWEKNVYTVTFNVNMEGLTSPDTQNVEHGEKAAKPDDPSKDGYKFLGWFEDDAADAFDFDTEITKNITLTAKWAEFTPVYVYFHAINVADDGTVTSVKRNDLGLTTNGNEGSWYTLGILKTDAELAPVPAFESSDVIKYEETSAQYQTVKTQLMNALAENADPEDAARFDRDTTQNQGFTDENVRKIEWTGELKTAKAGNHFVDGGKTNCHAYHFDGVLPFYTVTYDANGGTMTDTDNGYWLENETYTVSTTVPTRDGYKFLGWATTVDAETPDVGATFNMPGNNVTLHAVWQEKTFFVGYWLKENGEWQRVHSENVPYTKATTHTLWMPTIPDGYAFDGWYQDEKDVGKEGKPKFTTMTQAKKWEFYADFTAIEYEIHYEYRDKDIAEKKLYPDNKTTYTVKDTVTLKDIEADGEHGKKFVEWRCDLDKDGVAEKITEIPKGTTGNLIISAHWNYPVNYTVFDANGDKIDSLSRTEYVFEDVLRSEEGYKLTALTQDGHTFDGWYQDDDDLGKTEKLIKDQTLKGAKKWELYGKLTPKEYTVTFDPNAEGASVDPTKKIVTFDAAYDTLPTPTREGYTFEGWYLSKTEFTPANKVEATTIVKTPGDHTLYANWAANTYKVTFDPKGGEVNPREKNVTFDAAYGELPTPTRENYRFVGWYLNGVRVTKDTIVKTAANHTLLAGWSRSYYALTINYVDRNGKKLEKSYEASVALGADFSVPSPKIKGYKLKYKDDAVVTGTMTAAGYTYDVVYLKVTGNGGGTYDSPNKTKKTAPALTLNTADHFAFINGYPDGSVQPEGNVTRAETAAILYRIMGDDCQSYYKTTSCSYSDVARGDWFNTYVATLENAGVIVDTRTNGKFRPNDAITRAELASMIAQFAGLDSASAASFNDVGTIYWAAKEIAKVGWINGYPDGSFRPDQNVTRAELMAMVNRALGRTPKSEDDLLSGMKTWSDNANTGAWYYLDVQEATNSHTYTKSGTHETWKKLR